MKRPKPPLTIQQMASRGGKASAEKLTPEQRKAKAKKAIRARWKKYRQQKKDQSKPNADKSNIKQEPPT